MPEGLSAMDDEGLPEDILRLLDRTHAFSVAPPLPEHDDSIEDFLDLFPKPEPLIENKAPVVPLTREAATEYALIDDSTVRKLVVRLTTKLLQMGPFSFRDTIDFEGYGIYVIYYQGENPIYALLRSIGSTCPMYVGKAGQENNRHSLSMRLIDHRKTLERAQLGLENFTFRFVSLPFSLLEFSEAALIRLYRPLWNCYLKGFGERAGTAKGVARGGEFVSAWDTYHAGRVPDTSKLRDFELIEQLIRQSIPACRKAYDDAQALLAYSSPA